MLNNFKKKKSKKKNLNQNMCEIFYIYIWNLYFTIRFASGDDNDETANSIINTDMSWISFIFLWLLNVDDAHHTLTFADLCLFFYE